MSWSGLASRYANSYLGMLERYGSWRAVRAAYEAAGFFFIPVRLPLPCARPPRSLRALSIDGPDGDVKKNTHAHSRHRWSFNNFVLRL